MKREEIIERIKKHKSGKIKFGIADIDGVLRGKYIPKSKFFEAVDSYLSFCDVLFGWDMDDACYDNVEVTGWHTGYPDARATIDTGSFREIPWEDSVPFFLADLSQANTPHQFVCPRSLLKRIDEEGQKAGFKAIFAFEAEWFNFNGLPGSLNLSDTQNLEPITPGMFGYSDLRTSLKKEFIADLFEMLGKFDIPLEGLHTETGPGVYEASVAYDEIVAAADKAILFKTGVKEISYLHNMTATFMAKWNARLPGSGGHIHQSLWDKTGENNLFIDNDRPHRMSRTLEHYIAGQLACLPEILPMYAPVINSYKRIGHGDWAPATLSWGIDNRTTSIRVIPGEKKSFRTELRVPGADINPYLAMAASLASGLYGIKHQLKLPGGPTQGNAYASEHHEKLPNTLGEATLRMKNSTIARELFGDPFVNHFVHTREWELRKFADAVTDWELKRYFEII